MNNNGDVIIFPRFEKEKRSQRCSLHIFNFLAHEFVYKTTTLNSVIVKQT